MQASGLKVLVIDDEDAMREVLGLRLSQWGYRVARAASAAQGWEQIAHFQPDIVICDVVMPDQSGLELVNRASREEVEAAFVMITAHGTVDIAVEAMKNGAFDFLTKPLDYKKLRAVLRAAAAERESCLQMRDLGAQLEAGGGLGELVGRSHEMLQVYGLIRQYAQTDASVLITGESGTGKDLAARTIHRLGARGSSPFVAINSAAIPSELIESELFGHEKGAFTGAGEVRPGCFEQAHGGTLFLDEIAEMPVHLQPKLLRVLEDVRVRRLGARQEKRCDVRLLTATNRDPRKAVEEGKLREDLYYRIQVLTLEMPPLRERREDLQLLSLYFLDRFRVKHGSQSKGFRESSLDLLGAYAWPGNVRELRNLIERAVVLAGDGWIEHSHFPPYLSGREFRGAHGLQIPADITAAEAEKRFILHTLDRVHNNKAEAARQLGLDVKTIRNKLKAYEADQDAPGSRAGDLG